MDLEETYEERKKRVRNRTSADWKEETEEIKKTVGVINTERATD